MTAPSFARPAIALQPSLPAAVLLLPVTGILAIALLELLGRTDPAPSLVLVAGVVLVAVLALALVRYELSVRLSVLLIGVVFVEPAPVDALLAVVMAVALVTGRVRLGATPLFVAALLSLFIALNLLSMIEAVALPAATRFLLITAYLIAFSVWFAGFVDSRRRAAAVMRAYVAGAVAMALVTTLTLFFPLPFKDLLLRYDWTRAAGLFEDPNVFGPFLIPAAVLVTEELLYPRLLRGGPLLKVAMLCALSLGILVSYSRAAWGSYVAALLTLLVVLALRRRGGRRAAAALAVLITVGVGAAAALAVTGSLDFLEQRAGFQSYDVQRFGAQSTGLELAAQRPLGVGPGQFDVLSDVSTHSTYVRALAEQGVLGFFTILAIFLATLVLAGRNAVLGRDTYGIGSATLLATWVGLLVNSLVIDTLHWRHLWLVAALVWSGSTRPRGSSPGGPATPGSRA